MFISAPSPHHDITVHDREDIDANRKPRLEPHSQSPIKPQSEVSLDFHEKRRNSLDYSERRREGIHAVSFCRHLRDSLKFHKINLAYDSDEDERHESTPRRPSTTGRRVRFEEAQEGIKVEVMGPLIKPSSEMTEGEKCAIWWRHSDLETFANDIAAACSDPTVSSESVPGSYASTLKKVYQICCSKTSCTAKDKILSHREQLELVSWVRVALARRGLEHYSVPFLIAAKKQNREKAVRSVIEHQKRVGCVFDSNSKCDSLRSFLEKRTHPSTLFARLLAEADEAALEESFRTGHEANRIN